VRAGSPKLGGNALRIATLFWIVLVGACATSPGRLEANRFQHASYPYALFYTEGADAEYPLGRNYTLDNFYSPDGKHRHPRLGPEYTVERLYNDESPAMVGREAFYDLLLTREAPNVTLWVRSVPLPGADAEATLSELAQGYLNAVSGQARVAAPFGVERAEPAESPAELDETRSFACTLSGREALRVDFKLTNPEATRTITAPEAFYASVVLVRTGYLARERYPVLLLVGRSEPEPPGAVSERDFDRLLTQLVLGDEGQGLSLKGGHTCDEPRASAQPATTEAVPSDATTSGGEYGSGLEVPNVEEEPAEAVPEAP
jgi:hypothetical protein